jgi:hypothetical protein
MFRDITPNHLKSLEDSEFVGVTAPDLVQHVAPTAHLTIDALAIAHL